MAAIALASGGVRPTLLDRDATVGDALCGGFLSWRTAERLRAVGIGPIQLGAHPVETLALIAGKSEAIASLPSPGFGLSRRALDTALRRRAVTEGARLVIVDPLRQLHLEDENQSAPMSALMSIFKQVAQNSGAAVLVAHHSSRAAGLQGYGDSADAGRGSTALKDDARWQINLVPPTREVLDAHGVPANQAQALMCYEKAAQLGHAKSMNLVGRYLEEGQFCPRDLDAAVDWYRRSAEAGDFRGQFSHATLLAQDGQVDEAVVWLEKALMAGNSNFLRVSSQTLLDAPDPKIRAVADAYMRRLAQLVG